MCFWRPIIALLTSLLSRIFAWRYDQCEEPATITLKRRELIDTIPRSSAVLEIGAGTGASLTSGIYQGSQGAFSALTLVEPDDGMRQRLVDKLDNNHQLATGVSPGKPLVVNAALPNLPFQDASFDAVVMFFVASHMNRRVEGMAEVARVLKPRGKFLFIDHGAHNHNHHDHHDHDQHDQHDQHNHTYKPFFYEWLQLKFWKRNHDSSLDVLLHDFRQEKRLEQLFERRLQVDYFFKEITYGCFLRTE